jgi:Tfp pilus assembly protein PilV
MKTSAYKISDRGQNIFSVRRAARMGFTLPEVMVSVAVTMVVFVSLYVGISCCFRVVQSNRENVRATQILQEKMEVARQYTWSQLTNSYVPANFTAPYAIGAPSSVTYTGTVTIANAPITESYGPDIQQIRVQLTWNSGRVSHSREMTTFISKYGLQNYLY